MKVDAGADCTIMPLPCFHTAFPKHFTKSGALKKSTLKPTWATWSAHDGECRIFLGYIVLNVQHKTLPQTLSIKFYVFEILQIQPFQDHPHIKKTLFQDHQHNNPPFQDLQATILTKISQLTPPNQAAYLSQSAQLPQVAAQLQIIKQTTTISP